MVIAIDTNILARIFIDDGMASAQVQKARQLSSKADKIYIAQAVQLELVWVLSSAYRLKKPQIIAILKQLESHSVFMLQRAEMFAKALAYYQQGKADFSDYLILLEAEQAGAEVYTFDKQFIAAGAKSC